MSKSLVVEVVTEGTSLRISAKEHSKIIALGDVHVPFHDPVAIDLFFQIAKTVKPSAVIVAGDFVDFYAISRFVRTPERRLLLADEIGQARQLLHAISKTFPKAEKIFLCGNHELRLKTFLYTKAPELAMLPELELKRLLGLDNWHFLDYQPYPQPVQSDTAPTVYIGELIVQHGGRLGISGNAVNTARCMFLRTLRNILVFHFHHFSQYLQMDYTGSVRGAWVIPCLCLPRPHYDDARMWAQGFAVLELYPDNTFRVTPVIFINKGDTLMANYEGKQFEVRRR
jgi:hypothetical protein